MPKIAIQTRLQALNLVESKIRPTNLDVAAKQTVVLDVKDPKLSAHVDYLEPKSIDDLKRWIGAPDSAFAHTGPAVSPLPIVLHSSVARNADLANHIVIQPTGTFHPVQVEALQTLTKNYLYGNSTLVSKAQIPAMNEWVLAQKIKIPIFIFADIHVASGAVLVLKNRALFANYITIDKGGLIKAGNQCVIHAAGVKGL